MPSNVDVVLVRLVRLHVAFLKRLVLTVRDIA